MLGLLLRLVNGRHTRHVLALLTAAGGACWPAGRCSPLPSTPRSATGLYWAVTTATTVGYGDVTPKDPAGRVVAAAVMLTTIPMLAAVFALVTGATAAATVRRMLDMAQPVPDRGVPPHRRHPSGGACHSG